MGWSAACMALLAMVSVGLWTLRVALTARGRRIAGAAVAAVEAVVFALAFSNLVSDLHSWERIAGYALGVAVGTIGGLVINDRLSGGAAVVEVVLPGDGGELRDEFYGRGWPATFLPATGVGGVATVLLLVVHAKRVDEVVRVVRSTSPGALWVVRPATAAHGMPGMATSVSI
jgi:uncharacterized protein YebE (UPF0316 family)